MDTEEDVIQRTTLCVVAIFILTCAGQYPASQPVSRPSPTRAQAGDSVRVVRFNVKPDKRSEFETFFWHSLKPAARILNPAAANPVGNFRLLVPRSVNRTGHFTYYVMVDPIEVSLPSGEAMRDMVRRAFPGADGQERVERWVSSIALGPLAPEGEEFIEADLDVDNPPPLGE